jgi:hypothetical protein
MFKHFPANRPAPTVAPWLIDGNSGKKWAFEEIKQRCEAMAVSGAYLKSLDIIVDLIYILLHAESPQARISSRIR